MRKVVTAMLFLATLGAAQAHIVLDIAEAPSRGFVRAAIRVSHGCGESTKAVHMLVPEGVTGIKPQPKPGWTIELVPAEPAGPGHEASEALREIIWRGDLPNAYYDEFVVFLRMPDAAPGSTVWFPFVQECEDGAVREWVERAASGGSTAGLHMPAWPVRVVPKP